MREAMVEAGGARPACAVLGAALAVWVVLLAAPAAAVPPVELDGLLTDQAGVVDDPGAAEAALEDLEAQDVQLWTTFVDSFDDTRAAEWAQQTAARNGLGLNDALLAVAVEDRQYYLWVDESFPLEDDELADVAAGDIEPALGASDWTGAVVAAADGMQGALAGGGGVPLWVWALPLIAVGGWLIARPRRPRTQQTPGGSATPEQPRESLDELAHRADALLVDTDDAVDSSREELGFAEAQFGAQATQTFRDDLDTAAAELSEAFRMRQEAERAPDEARRRALLEGVISRAQAADARLDAHVEEFERLRDLEANAPQLVAGLSVLHDQVRGRIAEAEGTLERLRTRYAPTVVEPVAENPTEAARRLEAARTSIDEAQAAIAADDRSSAVLGARVAESAIAQAARLLDAVERLDGDIQTVDARLAELLAETRRDVDEAGRAPQHERARLAGVVREAQLAVHEAEAERAAERPDPLATLRRLRAADDALEAALVPAREAAHRAERARRQLDAAIAAARAEISGVDDYIRTRRGAVGPDARTRLAAAKERLDEAVRLRDHDPESALRAAQDADALAEEAARLARHDRDSWSGPGRSGGGVDLGSLILGGILLGGRGGGGFGGGGFGGGFGGGGGGGGFGGGFGGSGGGRGVGGRF